MTQYGTHIETLLSNDRISNLIKYSQFCSNLPGYYAEFGIFRGGSLEILAKYNPGKDILAIDSFAGVPRETDGVDVHREGDFSDGVNYHKIAGFFGLAYPQVRIFRGYSPDVFNVMDIHTHFAFVHLDVDMFSSVLQAMDFFLPRMVENGIILCDDFRQKSTPGCEKAIDKFFSNEEIKVKYRGEVKYWNAEDAPSNYQYLIVK